MEENKSVCEELLSHYLFSDLGNERHVICPSFDKSNT